jgi:hypothetical protein
MPWTWWECDENGDWVLGIRYWVLGIGDWRRGKGLKLRRLKVE